MTTLLAVLGGLGFIGLVTACILFVLDIPARDTRLRRAVEVEDAAWRIQAHTQAVIEQMLDEARRHDPH